MPQHRRPLCCGSRDGPSPSAPGVSESPGRAAPICVARLLFGRGIKCRAPWIGGALDDVPLPHVSHGPYGPGRSGRLTCPPARQPQQKSRPSSAGCEWRRSLHIRPSNSKSPAQLPSSFRTGLGGRSFRRSPSSHQRSGIRFRCAATSSFQPQCAHSIAHSANLASLPSRQ